MYFCKLPYNEFISLGAILPKWWFFSFSRNFADLEIDNLNNLKTHMSDISHKVYKHLTSNR